MRIKTLMASAVATVASTAAFAGGYDAEITEAPMIVPAPMVETGSSMSGILPLILVLGVLAIAAALSKKAEDVPDDTGGYRP